MANKKISDFSAVKDADIDNMTAIAGVGIDTQEQANQNVRISGAELISSLNIPTKTSDITNDSGFITSASIPTVPTLTSELTNDSGFITSASLPTVNNGELTITVDGAATTFTANEAGNKSVSITTGGSGTVTGTGTANKLTMWSAGGTGIEDSLVEQNTGTNIISILGDGASNASQLQFNCSNNNHNVNIIGPDHTNSPLSYSLKLPNKIAEQPVYVSGGRVLESNASGTLQWITTPSGGGGSDAFNSLTVNVTTREATWTYATDGANIKLTPLSPFTAQVPGTRTKIVLGDTFPNGASGYLLVDPSNTNNFELPSNSLISGGAPEAFNAGLTRYTYVYDGTNFWWTREQAMVTPTYLPVGLITDQQIYFGDPATFTQYTTSSGVNVVNNLSTWANSENIPAPLGDLQGRVDETDPQYDNYMGWVAAAGSEPAYFDFRPDETFGSDDKYFTSTLNPDLGSSSNTNVTEWSWFGWIKSTSDLPNTDMWLVDGYNGSTYDEGVKFKDKRIGFYQGTSSTGTPDYTNFPAFDATGYEDKWTYVCVTIKNTGNATAQGQATLYLGNETTFAAAGGTVTGYDGSNINIEGTGLYKFTFPPETFDDDAITSFFVGSNGSSSASNSGKPLYGMYLGEIGFYQKTLTDPEVGQNFNITRLTYGVN